MEPSSAKVVSMVALGLGSFVSGMLPACISERSRQKHPLLISCLLCFGGGVLLSTSMVHMLSEAKEKIENAELMFCVGFFIVYFVDEIVHLFYRERPTERVNNYGAAESTRLLRERNDEEMGERCGDAGNSGICHINHTEPCAKNSSGIIGLIAALLVHSALEGLAIGLQDTTSKVWLLLGAVSCHKFVVGFCLGALLCASFPRQLCTLITCIAVFSGGSVVGIAAGAGLDSLELLQNSPAVNTMQAIAAGTLLYVTVSEVMPRERAKWHERRRGAGLVQFTAVAAGFALMVLLTKYLDIDGA